MNQEQRIELFKKTTALLSGHFVLRSGFHVDQYVAKRRLYSDPVAVEKLCREIAEYCLAGPIVQGVVSPAVGGVVLSQWVGFLLTQEMGCKIPAVFVEKDEKDPGEFKFSEGCGDFICGKDVLLVDDVLTTGRSVEGARRAVVKAGGRVVAVSVLWQRCEKIEMDVPFYPLVHKVFPAWEPNDCPLCAHNIPFIKLK